jgi:hypothetical protein
MWHMNVVREKAISALEIRMSEHPARRIDLARRFEITNWMRPAFAQLVAQDTPLAVKDAVILGLDTVLKLCAVREHLLKRPRTYMCFHNHVVSCPPGRIDRSAAMNPGLLEGFGIELVDNHNVSASPTDSKISVIPPPT